jgi:hypothetical protein
MAWIKLSLWRLISVAILVSGFASALQLKADVVKAEGPLSEAFTPEFTGSEIAKGLQPPTYFTDAEKASFTEVVEALGTEKDLRKFSLRVLQTFTIPDVTEEKPLENFEFNIKTCSGVLEGIAHVSFNRSPQDFDLSSLVNEDGTVNDTRIRIVFSSFFKTRMRIRRWLRRFARNPEFSADLEQRDACVNNARMMLRTIRGWEDYWGLWWMENRAKIQGVSLAELPEMKDLQVLTGGIPHFKINPVYKTSDGLSDRGMDVVKDLESGYMVLTRGKMFTGAVIGHTQAIDNQFAHAAIIYKDEDGIFKDQEGWYKGKPYVIESVPDKGVRFEALESYMHHGDVTRMAVFNYRHLAENVRTKKGSDADAVAESQMVPIVWVDGMTPPARRLMPSRLVRQRMAKVAARLSREGLLYNFSMQLPQLPASYDGVVNRLRDVDNGGGVFCSQLVKISHDIACNELQAELDADTRPRNEKKYDLACETLVNNQSLPTYMSKFDTTNNLMSDILGMPISQTFAPADLEIDPRVEIVAEWRKFQDIQASRYHDMIVSKVFQWLEDGGYRFRDTGVSEALLPLFEAGTEFSKQLTAEIGALPAHTPRGFVDGTFLVGFMMDFPSLTKVNGVLELIAPLIGEQIQSSSSFGLAQALLSDLPLFNGFDAEKQQAYKEAGERIANHFGMTAFLKQYEEDQLAKQQADIEKMGLENVSPLPLTEAQMGDALEWLRVVDCQRHKSGDKSVIIHSLISQDFNNLQQSCTAERFDALRFW